MELLGAAGIGARGLGAYARHPLLRAVEIDRSYYEPLPSGTLAAFSEQAPDGFGTVRRSPNHARYGKVRGAHNPRFLDAAYASDVVI